MDGTDLRDITLKVRVSAREKAVIEANARTSGRSVSAFMRERALGLHVEERVSRLVRTDLRRTALSLHRLAETACREQDEPAAQVLAKARAQVIRLLNALENEAP